MNWKFEIKRQRSDYTIIETKVLKLKTYTIENIYKKGKPLSFRHSGNQTRHHETEAGTRNLCSLC